MFVMICEAFTPQTNLGLESNGGLPMPLMYVVLITPSNGEKAHFFQENMHVTHVQYNFFSVSRDFEQNLVSSTLICFSKFNSISFVMTKCSHKY